MAGECGLGCYRYKGVLPFTMVATECANLLLKKLYNAATVRGMSHHVFVVYSCTLAALFPLHSTFFLNRSPPPTIMWKIVLLGLVGGTSQIMGNTRIKHSYPALASAIRNLVPAFTFVLGIIFRMERVTLSRSSSVAKVCGTAISIAGAFVLAFFKGSKIFQSPMSTHLPLLQSSQSNWVLGSLCLLVEYILVSLRYIVQAKIMEEYHEEVIVVRYYNLCVSILAAIAGIFAEPHLSKWKLRLDIALASIVCSGIFGSFLNKTVRIKVLRIKGPSYVTMFKPLSTVIAVATEVIIFGNSLYLGSVIGAAIIVIGFCTIMWGKATEEKEERDEANPPETSEPLLNTVEAGTGYSEWNICRLSSSDKAACECV